MAVRTLLLIVLIAIAPSVWTEDAHVDSIRTAVDASNWKEAIKLAELWVKDKPADPEAHYWLALALKTKAENVNKFRALITVGKYTDALDRAIALDPECTPASEDLKKIRNGGWILLPAGLVDSFFEPLGCVDRREESVQVLERTFSHSGVRQPVIPEQILRLLAFRVQQINGRSHLVVV